MDTKVVKTTEEELIEAAAILKKGGLVAFPTETVYGLAADATQAGAVHANYEAKGRPDTKPLNVLVDGMTMVENVCQAIPPDAYRLAEAFWPGPLTMILWGNGTLPDIVPAGGATQGVTCPASPVPSRPRRSTASWPAASMAYWMAERAPWGWSPPFWT